MARAGKKNHVTNPSALRLLGTSPLSFDLKRGATVSIRKSAPAKKGRPTVGGAFKSDVFIVYYGVTKVGHLNPLDVTALQPRIPTAAQVVCVDGDAKILEVSVDINPISQGRV